MNQTAGATNAYRRCSKGGKVRERSCVRGSASQMIVVMIGEALETRFPALRRVFALLNQFVDCGG